MGRASGGDEEIRHEVDEICNNMIGIITTDSEASTPRIDSSNAKGDPFLSSYLFMLDRQEITDRRTEHGRLKGSITILIYEQLY